jgi:hypothetical protein
MRFRARLVVSPSSEASSQRQGDGQRFQKKAMKTTNQTIEASAPANVRPAVAKSSIEQQRAFATHIAHRELPTLKVLELLKAQLPQQYELAEIVGRWIWLDFPVNSHRAAANTLWRLGFHWNQRRCLWQHPCGATAPYNIHSGDPRSRYGSRSATSFKAV